MKNIYILLSLLISLSLIGCQDVNDKFDWLDEAIKPVNIVKKTIEIESKNIATIVSETKKTDDAHYGDQLEKDKMFSKDAPASILIPYLLSSLYFSADPTSSVIVTYQYKDESGVIEERTDQFILTAESWIFEPTIVISSMAKDDYQLVIDYVIRNQAIEVSSLVNKYNNTEYYYGFNSYNLNITYRDSDRKNDPSYPINGTDDEKKDFRDKRTIEGLNIFLGAKFPDATPLVSGIDQKAEITVVLFESSSKSETFTYEFQCIGNKEWKFLDRKQ